MFSKFRFLIIFITVLLIPINVPASDLPTLPNDERISTGKLGNGITYYIAEGSRGTGLVDIALVQKVGIEDEIKGQEGETVVQAMKSLYKLPHFMRYSPYRYMSGMSIWPDDNGYVKVTDDATIFRFSNLQSGRGVEVVDSTLLMIFDIISLQNKRLKSKYYPDNQAVIVVGDVDTKSILRSMNMLSMLVTPKKALANSMGFIKKGSRKSSYIADYTEHSDLASVKVSYTIDRISPDYMNTILPDLTSRYFSELSIILRTKLSTVFAQNNIPYYGMDFTYLGSGSSNKDEEYTIEVRTVKGMIENVTSAISSVLGSIDNNGVGLNDYRNAVFEENADKTMSLILEGENNKDLVNTCVSSYLYGTSLASDKDRLDFFVKRNIDDSTLLGLFNNYISSVLDKSRNLTLSCRSDNAGEMKDIVLRAFDSNWDKPLNITSKAENPSLKRYKSRVKIRLEVPESVSGGKVWTFSNGIKVAYKQTPSAGDMVMYSWVLKGGYSQISDIKAGEGAYFSEMLNLYRVSGMSSSDFRNLLSSNGISMDADVTVSDFYLRGAAPRNNLPLLLNAMQCLVRDREKDTKAFDYYLKNEKLRLASIVGTKEYFARELEHIISRDKDFVSVKTESALNKSLQSKADKFYSIEFSKMNDGILILVGNIDEDEMKKILLDYIGGFNTSRSSSFRSRIANKNISGREINKVYGTTPSLSLALSAPVNYTGENYASAAIAAKAVSDAVAAAASNYGWATDWKWHFSMFPEETFNMQFFISQADIQGLPASMFREDSVEIVQNAVRNSVMRLAYEGINTAVFDGEKKAILNGIKVRSSNPEVLRSVMELRYAYGKDMMTNYDSKVKGISESSVNSIISSISKNAWAEYVVCRVPAERIDEPRISKPQLPAAPVLVPVSDFTYPFGNMKVPFDTTVYDLKPLENQELRVYPADSVMLIRRSKIDTLINVNLKTEMDSLSKIDIGYDKDSLEIISNQTNP